VSIYNIYKIAVFYPDAFNHGAPCSVVFVYANARATVPVAAVGLVVDLYNVFASSRNNAARVEHHACDRVVVGVGIVDGASPEVPDLATLATKQCPLERLDLLECFCLRYQ
jgi:hypothetical protein